MDMARQTLNFGDHALIAQQVGDFKLGVTGLAGTEQFAGATDLQILLRNHKAVVAVTQHLQALLGGFRQRGFVQQYAV